MSNIVEVSNLTKKRRKFLMEDVSFSLPYGYIMGLIGENGAGKSTLIHLLTNLLIPDSGTIRIFGKEYAGHEEEIKEDIGFVYDTPYLQTTYRLRDLKNMISIFYRNWDDSLYVKYMKMFNLDEKSVFGKLSKGNQMRFCIVLALSHRPKLLLMDEPTAGLDPVIRLELLELLTEIIATEECSIIYSSHITSDLDDRADYIGLIREGRMILYSDRESIAEQYAIVKGDQDLMRYMNHFAGYREKNGLIEALTFNKEFLMKSQKDIVVEPVNLQKLMYFTSGDRYNKNRI